MLKFRIFGSGLSYKCAMLFYYSNAKKQQVRNSEIPGPKLNKDSLVPAEGLDSFLQKGLLSHRESVAGVPGKALGTQVIFGR